MPLFRTYTKSRAEMGLPLSAVNTWEWRRLCCVSDEYSNEGNHVESNTARVELLKRFVTFNRRFGDNRDICTSYSDRPHRKHGLATCFYCTTAESTTEPSWLNLSGLIQQYHQPTLGILYFPAWEPVILATFDLLLMVTLSVVVTMLMVKINKTLTNLWRGWTKWEY